MITQNKRSGFVLVIAMFIIAIGTLIIARLITQGIILIQTFAIERERKQAQLLALSAMHFAAGELLGPSKKEEKEAPKQEAGQKKGEDQKKDEYPTRLLKALNVKRTKKLTENIDGINGTIEWTIVAQEGKIPLNSLLEPGKEAFKKEYSKIIDQIDEKGKTLFKDVSLKSTILSAYKKRKRPFDDVSDLYEGQDEKTTKELKTRLFAIGDQVGLVDLFTAEVGSGLCPLLFTKAVDKLFDLTFDEKKLAQQFEKKEYGEKIRALFGQDQIDWKSSWDQIIAPIKVKRYTEVSEPLKTTLSKQCSGKVIGVMCFGATDSVTQKLFVILERSTPDAFLVRKVVWL